MKKLIAITGGIGSGKSVVSSILRILGYFVYDCDSKAKILMNNSSAIKIDLINYFGEQCILADGNINTAYISSKVFDNAAALKKLNSIVHPCVKEDIIRCSDCNSRDKMFVETAILLQSNLLDIIDDVWVVDAPESIRVERVMKRNSMQEVDVRKRIKAQESQDYTILKSIKTIINDGVKPLLPQVENLVKEIM